MRLRPLTIAICNSYTMGCPHVRGDNPRALASGLSYVQVDTHGITISVDLAHHEIFRAIVGKGGIKIVILSLTDMQITVIIFDPCQIMTNYMQ